MDVACDEPDDNGFDAASLDTLKIATISSASLSILGSGFIILTYIIIRTHRPLSLQILFWLSISDLCSSLIYIIDGLSPESELMSCGAREQPLLAGEFTYCSVKAATIQFFTLAAILWTGAVASNLHLGLVAQSRIARKPQQLLMYMHCCVWGIAAIVVVLCAQNRALGRAGQWCWILEEDQWHRLVFYYLPLLLVLFYSTGVYTLTRRHLLAMHMAARGNSVEVRCTGSGYTLTCTCIWAWACACACTCTCAYTYAYTYTHTCVHVRIHVKCMPMGTMYHHVHSTCMCTCACTCPSVCICRAKSTHANNTSFGPRRGAPACW